MEITLAQLNFTVGDFTNNSAKIIKAIEDNAQSSDLIVFPELCVCGYPPEDIVLRDEFVAESIRHTHHIIDLTRNLDIDILISTPWKEGAKLYNCSLIASNGKIIHKQYKYDLPNYGVFDEKRVFSSGTKPELFEYKGKMVGMLICEDIWNKNNATNLKGADFILSVNASPYEREKHLNRKRIVKDVAQLCECPVFYINQICGHDDLVFDGGSFIANKNSELVKQMNYFEEDISSFDLNEIKESEGNSFPEIDENQHIYKAMALGLKDYVEKNEFPGVIIGLSGGIDSALSAVVAVDALGASKVRLVMMPSKYTSQESLDDAQKLARNLGIELENISIEPIVKTYESELEPSFKGTKKDLTEENIQSRIRGDLLMALSNKFGQMVLSTGNKSEVAVGYGTLYGDMCGGYNVLKDIYKTRVFALCNWRNKNSETGELIPKNIITKAPTAELRENQKDEDSLPPYEVLDQILYWIIEQDLSTEEIAAKGFNQDMVHDVERMVYHSEYKRRQSAPGVKIGTKPFGRDRRYPITNKFM